MSEYQEEVLTNLLDLQAELRGDEAPTPEAPAPVAEPKATADEQASDGVAISEQDVTVSLPTSPSSSGVAVNERLAALNERLARLEHDLAGVTKRIERIEPEPELPPAESDADIDAPWRSFLDLQKIVADRLDDR
jgi:hypothetical protein